MDSQGGARERWVSTTDQIIAMSSYRCPMRSTQFEVWGDSPSISRFLSFMKDLLEKISSTFLSDFLDIDQNLRKKQCFVEPCSPFPMISTCSSQWFRRAKVRCSMGVSGNHGQKQSKHGPVSMDFDGDLERLKLDRP